MDVAFISAVSAHWDCHLRFGNATLIPGATQAKKKRNSFFPCNPVRGTTFIRLQSL